MLRRLRSASDHCILYQIIDAEYYFSSTHAGLSQPLVPLRFGSTVSPAQVVVIAPSMTARLTVELEYTTVITMKTLLSSV